jgi:hypothetical protein
LPIERHGVERLVLAEQQLQRPPHLGHLRVFEAGLAVDRRITRRREHRVALAEGDVERAGQRQHHLAAGHGAARLDEAEMPGRHLRRDGQIELAHAPDPAPFAQQRTDDAGVSDHRQPPRPRSAGRKIPRSVAGSITSEGSAY